MLNNILKKAGVKTHMISAENPTGEKSGACRAKIDPSNPDLYWSKNAIKEGYKVNPFIKVDPKTTKVLADVKGMGMITNLFLTSDKKNFSEIQLRIYFDGDQTPCVDTPLGAFFCMGCDGVFHQVNSLPIVVAPFRGCNSYFQMPFRKGFKVEIENKSDEINWIMAYKIMYDEVNIDESTPYFHATYNHTLTKEENPTHVILDNVNGCGVYVGTYLAWTQLEPQWWGEGEVKFYIDGDKEYPSICDNGTEDYFGGAWNFGSYGVIEGSKGEVFNTPFLGQPLVDYYGEINNRYGMYRFHILDGIGFSENIKVTVDTIGWPLDHAHYKHTSEDVGSVAYYYLRKK